MISYFILRIPIEILTIVFGLLGSVTSLPWGTDAVLVNAVGMYKTAMGLFPFLEMPFRATMLYMGFRISLLLAKQLRIIK